MKKRILILVSGTCFISVGISLMYNANIGMSPLTTCPYVLSLMFPMLSLGEWVLVWNVLFALLQIPIMGKNYKWYYLTQIPLAFLLGYFTDFVKWLIRDLTIENYVVKLLFLLLGTMFTGLGVFMTVEAKLIMNGPEAFLRAIADKTGWKFGTLKTTFDVCNVILATLVSLLVYQTIMGVREGTIFAAVFTGVFVNLYGKLKNRLLRIESH